MKTVFFGPFIGELGWELLYWQGWVRKVCQGEYKNYRKIASSFPGREAFYPYVDEFWPHPKEILNYKISQRDYITDFWRNGFPNPDAGKPYPNFEPVIRGLLKEYKQNLPEDTLCYVPFDINYYQKDNIQFGVSKDFLTQSIPFKYQLLELIAPTKKGEDAFKKIYRGEKKLIAIFPRCRETQRPDKNWLREKYDILIDLLQQAYGDKYKIAILGEPGGAFYTDGTPKDTLDLINVPSELRMDIQVAALKRTDLVLGGISGAILFALACGVPCITWGYFGEMYRYYKENFLRTKLIYHPIIKVSPQKIFRLCSAVLDGKSSLFIKSIPLMKKLSRLMTIPIAIQGRFEDLKLYKKWKKILKKQS